MRGVEIHMQVSGADERCQTRKRKAWEMTASAQERGGPVAAGRSGPLRGVATAPAHRWHRAAGEGGSGEGDHGAEVLEWHPGYQHEVAVVARLRHVACPGGCDETPAVVLQIDNADHAGEVAMTADDLSSMVSGLIGLRHALLPDAGEDGRR